MKRDALPFYRVMAYVTGVWLILLVIGMILRYGFGDPTMSSTVAPVHGWLYVIYLLATLLLTRQRGFTAGFAILTALAGTIPFASFVAERKVTRKAQQTARVQ